MREELDRRFFAYVTGPSAGKGTKAIVAAVCLGVMAPAIGALALGIWFFFYYFLYGGLRLLLS